ncbi:unnamed protein product, partial [Meganyctiphanes norvegica]
PQPKPAPKREVAWIDIPVDHKKPMWVCLRAVDRSGQAGPPSNPAPLRPPSPPSLDRVTVRGSGLRGYGSSGPYTLSEKVAVISGSILGVLLVVALVGTYCYCFPATLKRRFKGTHEEAENE